MTFGDHSPIKIKQLIARSRPRDWAERLAGLVEHAEHAGWRQLLGDDTQKINLGYHTVRGPGRAARNIPDSGTLYPAEPGTSRAPEQARAPDIREYFTSLRPRRLVITGHAGAGKTVLALELLLALIKGRSEQDPVPLWVPLAGWDTAVPLESHLIDLVRAYGWSSRKAATLVRQGWILPVLDGLDEMDAPGTDQRARAALSQINVMMRDRAAAPMVLTVRSKAYQQLTRAEGPLRERMVVDAAHVALDAVTVEAAQTYIAARAGEDERWAVLRDRLAARPRSALADRLSAPWGLCLVLTSYAEQGDPAELTRLGGAKLDHRLMSLYVQAAARSPGTRYRPADVQRWLHALAVGPARRSQANASVEPGVIDLRRLWLTMSRRINAARAAAITATPMLVYFLGRLLLQPHDQGKAYYTALAVGFSALLLLLFPDIQEALSVSIDAAARLRALANPLRAGVAVLGGAAIVAATALVDGHASLSFVCVDAVSTSTVLSLALPLPAPRHAISPRRVIRQDFWMGVVLCVISSAGFATAARNSGSSWHAALLLGAIGGGTWFVYGIFNSVWQRYAFFLFFSRRTLPLRLGHFLDWAASAGLLRRVGSAFQFRHRDLQDWLAAHESVE